MASNEGLPEASTPASGWKWTGLFRLDCVGRGEHILDCCCKSCWAIVSWCVVLRRFLGVASLVVATSSLFVACACLRLLCDQPTFAACDLTYFLFSRPEDPDSKTKLSPPLSALLDDCIPGGDADSAKTFHNSTLPSRASDVHVEPPYSAFPRVQLRVAILVDRSCLKGTASSLTGQSRLQAVA